MEFIGTEISAKQARTKAQARADATVFDAIKQAADKGLFNTRMATPLSKEQVKNLERLGFTVADDARSSVVYW